MTEESVGAKGGTSENTNQTAEEKTSKMGISITMDKRVDLALALFLIAYGLFMIIVASDFQEGRVQDIVTSKGAPYAAGAFLILCGIILTVMRIATWSALPGNFVVSEATKEDEEGYPASWKRAFAIIGAAWIDVWLLKWLGYLITTPLFLFFAVWAMGGRSWKRLIIFPLVFTLATWYVFSQLLGFLIPLGFLEPLARSLGFLL